MSRRSIPQSPQNPSTPDEPQNEPSYDETLAAQFSPAFAVIPGRALTDTRLSPAEFRVFALMCGHANRADRICWPKQETLAKMLGTDKYEISRAVRRLSELGYVQIIKRGFPLSNMYRIVFEDPSPSATQSCVPAQHRVASQRNTELRPSATKNRNIEQEHRTPSSPNVSFNSTSLAQSAEKRTDTLPPDVQAPAARERDFDTAALKRDPLTLALVACLGHEPATRRQWGQWRLAINDLHSAGISAADIPRAIRGYQTLYPKAPPPTPIALVAHWSEIVKGKPNDLAQLEIAQRLTRADAAAKSDRAQLEAERTAQERAEVNRLLSEYGYEAGG